MPFPELDRVTIWVSHIVIQDAPAIADTTFQQPMGFQPDPHTPRRPPEDALRIITKIANDARRDPSSFAELARKYSEDTVTRDFGGSLGGQKATQLPGEVLDAFVALKPGEISRVFRSSLGFHIIQRREAPPEESVAGQHLVIRYAGTATQPSQKPATRTRTEAFAIARQAIADAHAGAPFERVVHDVSESLDVVQDGDMGVFSVREPEYSGPQVEMLARLPLGAISEPMDSRLGVQVLKRVPVTERGRYAVSRLALRFEPGAAVDAPASREHVAAFARTLMATLKSDPSAFERLQREHCCEGVEQWTRGRGPVGSSEVLDGLAFGEVAQKTFDSDAFIVIAKRLDPSAVEHPAASLYEFPVRAGPDFEAIIRNTGGEILANYIHRLASVAPDALGLAGHQKDAFIEIQNRFASSMSDTSADHRVESARLTHEELRTLLGSVKFGEYERFLNQWASGYVLGTRE